MFVAPAKAYQRNWKKKVDNSAGLEEESGQSCSPLLSAYVLTTLDRDEQPPSTLKAIAKHLGSARANYHRAFSRTMQGYLRSYTSTTGNKSGNFPSRRLKSKSEMLSSNFVVKGIILQKLAWLNYSNIQVICDISQLEKFYIKLNRKLLSTSS